MVNKPTKHASPPWKEAPLIPAVSVARHAGWGALQQRMHLAEAISNHLVCPNECVSPQGSVEAQCGLVLNGQGGVIRRGKPPPFQSSVCLLLYRRPWTLTARHDKTQADKRAEHRSLVCCQHVGAGAALCFFSSSSSRLFKRCHTFPVLKKTDCQSTPTTWKKCHSKHLFSNFLCVKQIKMSTKALLIWHR